MVPGAPVAAGVEAVGADAEGTGAEAADPVVGFGDVPGGVTGATTGFCAGALGAGGGATGGFGADGWVAGAEAFAGCPAGWRAVNLGLVATVIPTARTSPGVGFRPFDFSTAI